MSTEPRYLGKYELRERLARGGQGEVWKAFDTQLRRYVAIKQLHANLQSDPDFTSRFEREAQFIASLHHPNIVQIHDFQLVHNPDSDITNAYMVMDYIEGPTLADYILHTSRQGQFPAAADIVYIFTTVSLAIDYAHEKGMIHRDIKPANIILDQRSHKRNAIGLPILTDFGIAKLQGVSADTTALLGTPLYISPEQAQNLAIDKRSDLYSLGIILYEMTTGVTPFRGDSVMAILMQHYQEPPTPPALINPNIPPTLSEVILKSIAKEPDARYSSATAMTIAVAESFNIAAPAELSRPNATPANNKAYSYNPLQLSQPIGMTPTPLTPPPIVLPPASQPPIKQRRTRVFLIALLVVAIVGSGLLFSFIVLGKTTTPNTPTPSPLSSVVGHVRFLSGPNAPQGSLNEVEIILRNIPDAPPGERYYAWLQINSESLLPIHWPLTTQNGGISSLYHKAGLLVNKPYLLLITIEKVNTDPQTATFVPGARLYYANLPATIQNSAPLDIHPCPQGGSSGICMS